MSLVMSLLACLLLRCAGDMASVMEKEKAEKTKFWDDFHASRYDSVVSRRSRVAQNITCEGGRAGGYVCDRVDLLGFISLEMMGCGYSSACLLVCLSVCLSVCRVAISSALVYFLG
mmetsp:Transcript_6748/g.12986  ORF Transcript_6748/g.12986 Transcript_6748/m.12986 type:complete len:116 (+) Transcript_6748:106-453(+)